MAMTRSIPACAGNPGPGMLALVSQGVHPRVCGESGPFNHGPALAEGPSPRVRGILIQRDLEGMGSGSIPACAGNPESSRPITSRPRVHPRVCGESDSTDTATVARLGPSPRVRGIPGRAAGRALSPGSIPACAGNPRASAPEVESDWVHPRVCGESEGTDYYGGDKPGPSPRVRGIRRSTYRPSVRARSIPACAGNPLRDYIGHVLPRVHPRVCGESRGGHHYQRHLQGPSPRVRGILLAADDQVQDEGSIPACAGNPLSSY